MAEFIDDLITMGGPEKEFEYNGKRYFMESQPYEKDPSLKSVDIGKQAETQ